jgi:hypothetical protein
VGGCLENSMLGFLIPTSFFMFGGNLNLIEFLVILLKAFKPIKIGNENPNHNFSYQREQCISKSGGIYRKSSQFFGKFFELE